MISPWVDDLIFVPVAIALAVRFVPSPVLAECRGHARERIEKTTGGRSWAIVYAIWVALAVAGLTLYIHI
jgi:hypothetical protein